MSCVSVGERILIIESIFGKGRSDRTNKNIAVRCPICENQGRNTKNKQKLIIRIDNDMCHCWVCGWKSRSALPLVKKFGTYEQFVTYKSTISSCININDQELKSIKRELMLPRDFILISKAPVDVRRKAIKYLSSRGLDWNDVELWNLGLSNLNEYKDQIIIPSFDKFGKLNFIVTRSYDSLSRQQYKNCDVEKTTIVFNEFNVNWSKPVIICEGPFDMFKCGRNSIPLLGCELSENHAVFDAILLNNPQVVIALDGDMRMKATKLAEFLSSYEINIKMLKIIDDPGKMSKSEIEQLLNNTKQWTWEQKMGYKIDSIFT